MADEVKRPLVERFLQDARRSAIKDHSEAVRKRFKELQALPSFSEEDAMKLLLGDERGMLDRMQVTLIPPNPNLDPNPSPLTLTLIARMLLYRVPPGMQCAVYCILYTVYCIVYTVYCLYSLA